MTAEPATSGMTIAHVNGRDAGGGTDVAAYSLHRELLRRGINSQLLVGEKISTDDSVTQLPAARGIPGLKRFSLKLEQSFGLQYLYSPRFRSLQDAFAGHVDLVHLHSLHGVGGYADIGHMPWLARRWPLVLSLQDMWMLTGHCGYGTGCERWKTGCGQCPDLGIYPAISKDGTRWNFGRKKRVIAKCPGIQVTACSEWLAQEARKCPIFEHADVHTVLNAIDTETFAAGDKQAARRKLGLPSDRFLILLCANLLSNVWKGAADGIQALNHIDRPDVEAVLVGHDSGDAEKLLRIPATVLPYQTGRAELAEIYRAADVLLMPSLEEAFGLVAAEAMACETPVVAYASGGLPEVVAEGCGVVVPTGDVSGLTTALNRLIDHRELCRSMGRAAAVNAAERFSIRRQAATFQTIYGLAIEKHRETAAHTPAGR
jgi:glycosyltransferase involved in cell wall biosynthesis